MLEGVNHETWPSSIVSVRAHRSRRICGARERRCNVQPGQCDVWWHSRDSPRAHSEGRVRSASGRASYRVSGAVRRRQGSVGESFRWAGWYGQIPAALLAATCLGESLHPAGRPRYTGRRSRTRQLLPSTRIASDTSTSERPQLKSCGPTAATAHEIPSTFSV